MALREAGAVVVDHGVVFDQNEIGKIFSVCHAGLNILKPEVFVGLTMKSLEYFKFGLPVINSLEGDTADFIKTYGVGFTLSDAPRLATLSASEINAMKKKVQSFFNSYLETTVIMRQTILIFKEIVGGGLEYFLKSLKALFCFLPSFSRIASFPFFLIAPLFQKEALSAIARREVKL